MLLDLEFAISSLAVCTSGTHVRKRQIRRLLDITEQNKPISVGKEPLKIFWGKMLQEINKPKKKQDSKTLKKSINFLLHSETISVVVIALHCIIHDHRNRNLHHYLVNPTKQLGKLQKEDGSFGDLKSSAFAIQALQSTDPGGRHWNKTTAINYIKSQQNDDDSFGEDDVRKYYKASARVIRA